MSKHISDSTGAVGEVPNCCSGASNHSLLVSDSNSNPVGIWCQNDVVSTSMRRDHVASTLIRRHFPTKCPLGILIIVMITLVIII